MTDTKISALTAASTPLAGTEVLPIVQSSTTVKVSVANLTAGRSVSAASLSLTTTPLAVTSGGTGTATAFTAGSVIFAGASGVYSQDNANLFWDDTNNLLGVGTATPDGVVTIPATNSNTPRLRFQHPSNNADASIDTYQDGGGTYLTIGTNVYQSSGASLTKFDSGKAGGLAYFDNSGLILFYTATAAGSFIEQLRIGTGTNADVTVKTGNLVIGTSGKGIDFSATSGTGTSELLDDYEEGTWTPVLSTDGTEPTSVTGTFTGSYVKVGRMVTAWGVASFTTYSNGTGIGRLGGLPFTCNTSVAGRGALGTEQCTFATGYTGVVVTPANGTAYVYPRQYGSAKDEAGVTLSTFSPTSGTTKYWIFTVQYETNS